MAPFDYDLYGDKELNENYKVKILPLVQKDVNFNNESAISIMCSKLCDGKTKAVPQLYNFETIAIKSLIHFSVVCECLICKISKLRGKEKHPLSRIQNLAPKVTLHTSQTSEKLCTMCLSTITVEFLTTALHIKLSQLSRKFVTFLITFLCFAFPPLEGRTIY